MKEIGYPKKLASIEAYQATWSDVLWKEECFFDHRLLEPVCGVDIMADVVVIAKDMLCTMSM